MSDPPATATLNSGDVDDDATTAAAANPVVRRRRRRIVRHVREKTPEPSAKGDRRYQYSDDDDDDDGGGGDDVNATALVDRRQQPQQQQPAVDGTARDSRQRTATAAAVVDVDTTAATNVVDGSVGGGGGGGGGVVTGNSSKPSISGGVVGTSTAAAPAASHRSKILTMRDRGVGPAKAIRSQSSPRVADAVTGDALMVVSSIGGTTALRPVKRSLSSQRHPEELLNRHFARDNRVPAREIPEPTTNNASAARDASPYPPTNTSEQQQQQQQQLTKLERNLLRFEEERRRFDEEKRRFEQEKRDAETMQRNRRLQAFQRKRDERHHAEVVDHDVHQKLCSILRVIEDSNKYHLPGISSPAAPPRQTGWRTSSGEEDRRTDTPQSSSASPLPQPLPVRIAGATPLRLEVLDYPNDSSTGGEVGEDYESSTAKSTSSREGDFDDEDADEEGCITVTEDLPLTDQATATSDANIAPTTVDELPVDPPAPKRSWFARLLRRDVPPTVTAPKRLAAPSVGPVSVSRFIFVETRLVWHQLIVEHPAEWQAARRCRNRCLADFVILMIVCGLGGLTFRFVEGAFENFYKCGVRRVKRDFVDHLWTNSHNLREDDWKTMARSKLRAFEEELHAAHEAGMTSYSGMKAWTFVNGMIYCLTVITTIGYGHIYPSTNTGRAITIVYALIGIPLFMILLNDFGKYFTWRIKFMVAFLRRLGNTSSLGRIYRQVYVQKIVRSINKLYSFAIFKRNRAIITPDPNFKGSTLDLAATSTTIDETHKPHTVVAIFRDSAIDDAFDLPVSVALAVLTAYIAAGSVVFSFLENWSLFEAGYFAFVSMSTIGLGDYVPTYPLYMMISIGYLVFGLALTAMCLSVLQARLDGALQRICERVGATLGLDIGQRQGQATGAETAVPLRPESFAKERLRKLKKRTGADKLKVL